MLYEILLDPQHTGPEKELLNPLILSFIPGNRGASLQAQAVDTERKAFSDGANLSSMPRS